MARLDAFTMRRSLWLDEAMLSLNVVNRGFVGLTKPLAYNQGAPLGWLWVQRLLVVLFGANEYSLRVLSLLSGCAAVVVVVLIAYRTIGRWGAASAAVLLSLSPVAIRYSNEAKQYSSDLLVAATLVLATVMVGDRGTQRRDVWAWALIGAIGIWLSHPALLVVSACALSLGLQALLARSGFGRVLTASAVWAVSAVIVYVVSLRRLSANAALRAYWAGAMAPRPLTAARLVTWLGRDVPAVMTSPGHLAVPWVALGLAAAGALVLMSRPRSRLLAAILIAIASAAVTAAAADRYPLGGRLGLYLLVAVVLALAAVVQWSADHLRAHATLARLGLLLTAAVASTALWSAIGEVSHPFSTPDIRDALRFVSDHRQAGDHVWVQWAEVPDALFYARTDKVVPDGELLDGTGAGSGGCGGQAPADAAQAGRVWVVLGYRLSTAPSDERRLIIARLAQVAAVRERYQRRGAQAFLLDFGAAVQPAPGGPSGQLQCLRVGPFPGPWQD